MEEERKENSQDKNFMYQLAELIVDKRNILEERCAGKECTTRWSPYH